MKLFSFGGGVQSTACLVLAAQGKIDYKDFAFADVGDKAEHPDTVCYLHEVSIPFAKSHGLNIFILQKRDKNGDPVDLYDRIYQKVSALTIPVYLSGGKPAKRDCTNDFKIAVIDKFAKKNGYTIRGQGISTDEAHRCRTGFDYPLIDLGFNRGDCEKVILDAGLPKAPKSACWFCPYTNMNRWYTLKRENPELFEKAVGLEKMLSDRYESKNKGPVYLSSRGCARQATIDQVISDQLSLFDEFANLDNCESGYCWT